MTHKLQGEAVPLHDRRQILAWLPILAVGCAVPRRAPQAAAAKSNDATPKAISPLFDQVVVQVIDTTGNLSPRARTPVPVRLRDLVLYHGHACDGLVIAARGIAYGLADLFDGGPVDRTDMAAATNASVCYGDVAEYLTGARHRYGSMLVDGALGDEWILLRRTTKKAVRVALRPGIKPSKIGMRESALRAADCPSDLITEVESLQRELAAKIWLSRPDESFLRESINYPYDASKLRGDVAKRDCPSAPKVGVEP